MKTFLKMPPLILILSQRIWQGAAGIITVLVISRTMSIEVQGWYYSFLSFAALYTLLDLGLSLVLVQAAAHFSVESKPDPKARLRDASSDKLAGLFASALRHYTWLAIAFLIVVAPAGWWFFSTPHLQPVAWHAAWISLALITALSLLPLPVFAIVEGTGEIAVVAAVRLMQAVLGALATWVTLLVGGGIWATVVSPFVSLIVGTCWIAVARPGILAIRGRNIVPVDWRHEIWPHQWRLGFSWLSGYLLTQVQTLVIFGTGDAAAAGQMGLSLTIGNMIGLISQSFIARHVPAMAKAAACRNWEEMDSLFRRSFAYFCLTFIAMASVIWIIATLLAGTLHTDRILAPDLFALLLAALFAGQMQSMLAMQLRSYRKEPLVWVGVAGAVLTISIGIVLAKIFGVAGVITAMLSIQIAFVLPASAFLFVRLNRVWRKI